MLFLHSHSKECRDSHGDKPNRRKSSYIYNDRYSSSQFDNDFDCASPPKATRHSVVSLLNELG